MPAAEPRRAGGYGKQNKTLKEGGGGLGELKRGEAPFWAGGYGKRENWWKRGDGGNIDTSYVKIPENLD